MDMQETIEKQDNTLRHPLRPHFSFMWKLCLVYGILYMLFAYRNYDGIGCGFFSLLSAIFILIIARHINSHSEKENGANHPVILPQINKGSLFYLLMAVLISISCFLTDNLFLLFCNHVGSILLFTIACIKLFYNDRKWDFGKYGTILLTYWVKILEGISMPFEDFIDYRHKKEHKMSASTKYIFIGIIFGLPILAVTTLLLASADSVFSDLLDNIFNLNGLSDWFFNNLTENIIWAPLCFAIYTLLLYLVFGILAQGNLPQEISTRKQFPTLVANTIFTMIDVMYIIFCGIQFIYLFGKVQIEQTSYAQYAREGFFQLLFVALINYVLVLFCNNYFQKSTTLRIFMTITCICTYIMMTSSAYRMIMYIKEYHLTFLRVFVLWFLLVLAFLMAGCLISIYKNGWNSFRYALFVFTLFYAVFSFSNVDKIIANYNIDKFEQALSTSQNTPYLSAYLPDTFQESLAYSQRLQDLKTKYNDELGSYNLEQINNYFNEGVFNYYFNTGEASADDSIWTIRKYNVTKYNAYKVYKSE